MTKGQVAPTSRIGTRSKSTPNGSWEQPIDPPWVALTSGATFVAQVASWNLKQTADLIYAGLMHPGTSFINVLSPCVTFHKDANKDYFKGLSDDIPAEHDATDFGAALGILRGQPGRLPIGLIYQSFGAPTYGDGIDSHVKAPNGKSPRELVGSVLDQFR
jgi:2-oxoglutarate ferredoxin oxidoreductase subunit beta